LYHKSQRYKGFGFISNPSLVYSILEHIFRYYILKILLLAPAPENAMPSQRFRFEHYIHLPDKGNLEFTYSPFHGKKSWRYLHRKNHFLEKIAGVVVGFVKRFFTFFTLHKYDFVFIHRETAPIGPPVFEWLIAKVFRKKIIYDFDDAIWINHTSETNSGVQLLKCTWKTASICKWSTIVSVGNKYLADYAKKYCKDVRIIPTVVDTEGKHNLLKDQSETPLVIGWTGTYTNFIHLPIATAALKKLKETYKFIFLVIADRDPELSDIEYSFKKWEYETEIKDLLMLNIGIMPLQDMEIVYGKCAFKAIQYMSLGIPAVVTPIAANTEVVDNGINGFWAGNMDEWYQELEQLICSKELRQKLGSNAHNKIIQEYSVEATKSCFFTLFQ